MSEGILVAIVSGLCTLLGSALGVIASNKLTQYRLQKLEEKVDAHNKFDARIRDQDARLGQLELRVGLYHGHNE